MSWMALFVTFVVWFNHAPLMSAIQGSLALTKAEVSTLLTLNVALAIPARIVIGMLTDKFGPRLVYSTLLLGCIGAGFVVGIRIVGEWFPAHELGRAEGVYGGWGNFGSAAAAMSLPTLALLFGGDEGWRYAIGATGVLAVAFGVLYYVSVSDTPKGSTYFKPRRLGAIEVTSTGDFFLLLVMKAPIFLALALLTWKLSPGGVEVLSDTAANTIYAFLLAG